MTSKEYDLNSKEKAILYMLHAGCHSNDIDPILGFNTDIQQKLMNLELIMQVPDIVYNDNDFKTAPDIIDTNRTKFILTLNATRALTNNTVVIQYPLEKDSKIESYDKTVQTMSDSAAEALCCSQINNEFFNKLPINQVRVLMQHLLDINIHHKMGKELIFKYLDKFKQSAEYFERVERKYKEQSYKTKNNS